MEQDLRYRISQDEMRYLYESAKARMDFHVEHANKQKDIIAKQPFFKTEREALQAALKLIKKPKSNCQIWVKIEKGDDGIFRVQNNWIVTDDVFVKLAAEYIGMALMYDESRILNIINSNTPIDEVIAYY